jgi:CheY-like chemotaxis protein
MARVEKRMRVQLLKQVLSLVSEEEVEEIVRAPEAPASEKTERVPGKHILLIEDSTSLRLYLRKALEQGLPGYQVKEAAEGNAALKMMTACEIRMVITDLQMPGMDGETFLQHLQRDPAHADKPVIVLSGNIPTYMIPVLKARPNYRLMFKPTTAEKVVQMARDLMFCLPNP